MSGNERESESVLARKGSLLGSFRAVAWSFLGIRRRSGYEADVGQLNPVHVIIAGLVAALVFILSLVFLVKWIVGSGVAA